MQLEQDFWTYKAKYRSNYDGDTVSLDIDLGFKMFLINTPCRLFGINCPELRGLTYEPGRLSKLHVQRVLEDPNITIVIKSIKDKSCKYGRPLIDLYYKQSDSEEFIHLNQELINLGLAIKYETKTPLRKN
jgi:micrococcal nuclease